MWYNLELTKDSEEYYMNILVIGNGFDLAHGLPTKYTDFLEFCKRVLPIYQNVEGRGVHLYQQEYLFDWDFNKEIKEKLKSAYESRRKVIVKGNKTQTQTNYPRLDEMYLVIKDNIWIEYFLQCNMYQKGNWIDFESEVSKVIQSLDDDMHGKSIECQIDKLSNKYLSETFLYIGCEALFIDENGERGGKQSISFEELKNRLYEELNNLIRGLEIYLCEYVEKIAINEKSPDIDKLEIDFILSFNYTHIFSKLYNVSSWPKQEVVDPFDYLHGEAKIDNTIETNNMVLGINEYLSKKRKNKETEFIAFKKYYQRIYKGTGCRYKDWINAIREENDIYMARKNDCEIFLKNGYGISNEKEEIRSELEQLNENPPRHNLYIFGHSLDVTDKDILRDLILNDNIYTTIFYPDKKELGGKIANLVKVIGQDELIRRTGGNAKIIEFRLQKPMEKREKI